MSVWVPGNSASENKWVPFLRMVSDFPWPELKGDKAWLRIQSPPRCFNSWIPPKKGVTTAVLLASLTNSLAKFICSGFFVVLQCSPKIGSLKKNCNAATGRHLTGFEFSRLGFFSNSRCFKLWSFSVGTYFFVTFAELGFFFTSFLFFGQKVDSGKVAGWFSLDWSRSLCWEFHMLNFCFKKKTILWLGKVVGQAYLVTNQIQRT